MLYDKILIIISIATVLVILTLFRSLTLSDGTKETGIYNDLRISAPNRAIVMPCDGRVVRFDETVSHYRLIIMVPQWAPLYYPANGQLANKSLYVNDPEENARDAAHYIKRGGFLLGKDQEDSHTFKPENNYYILLNSGVVIHLSDNAMKNNHSYRADFSAGDFLTALIPRNNQIYVSLLFPKMDYSGNYFRFNRDSTRGILAGDILGHYIKNQFSAGLANSEYEEVSSIGPWGLYLNAVFAQGPKN